MSSHTVDNTFPITPSASSSSAALVFATTNSSTTYDEEDEKDLTNHRQRMWEKEQKRLEEKIAMLERTKIAQAERIQDIQQELNELQVKHQEELFWLRLELDSTRRDKEAVEDRMDELYREIREMVDEEKEKKPRSNSDDVADLQAKVEKYERTLEILNNQIIMVKLSGEGVVKSLKDEISDLMEEKCKMEIDLLNQLATLHNEKRDIEMQLWEKFSSDNFNDGYDDDNDAAKFNHLYRRNKDNESDTNTIPREENKQALLSSPKKGNSPKDETFCSSFSHNYDTSTFTSSNWPSPHSSHSPIKWKNNEEKSPLQYPSNDGNDNSNKEDLGKQQTTAGISSCLLKDEEQYQIMEKELLRLERAKWKDSIDQLKADNDMLRKKIEDISGNLLLTKSSYIKDLQTLCDRQQHYASDREETLTNLERVSVLWDRADETIHVLESLMSELKPLQSPPPSPPEMVIDSKNSNGSSSNNNNNNTSKESSNNKNYNGDDHERFLSTLESTMLVHGQVKMSLTLIELKLRNQLTTLKSDQQEERQKQIECAAETTAEKIDPVIPETQEDFNKSVDDFNQRLEAVKDEALKSVRDLEDQLEKQIRQLQKRAFKETNTIKKTLEIQLNVLKQTHARHNKLEEKISRLREREKDSRHSAMAARVTPNNGAGFGFEWNDNGEEHQKTNTKVNIKNIVGDNNSDNINNNNKTKAKNKNKNRKKQSSDKTTNNDNTNQNNESSQNIRHSQNNNGNISFPPTTTSASNLYISKNVLLRLQNEVLLVVQKIQEKNETIGRLNASIAEHKIREEILKKRLSRESKNKSNCMEEEDCCIDLLQVDDDIRWHI